MTLIPAGAAHGPAMAAMHALAFPPRERWGADAMVLQLGVPGCFGLIDGDRGFILARVAADEAEILTVAVVPGARRQGVGRRLLAGALVAARETGAEAMFLEVAIGNAAARALYAEAGFREVGRRRGYYAGGGDALVLRASTSGAPSAG